LCLLDRFFTTLAILSPSSFSCFWIGSSPAGPDYHTS
jgi:hypothetical protein